MTPADSSAGLARLAALSVSVLLAATVAAGCKADKQSLIVVGLTSAVDLPGATEVTIRAAGTSHSFSVTALSTTTAVFRGLYVGSGVTGTVPVQAETRVGTPCVLYQGTSNASLGAAGDSVEIAIRLVASSGNCTSPDAGTGGSGGGAGGAGGAGVAPPSLTLCHEYDHVDPAPAVCTETSGPDTALWSVVFSHDGKMLATAGTDGRIKIWNVSGSTLTASGRVLTMGGTSYLAFSNDDKYLAAGSWYGELRIWSVPSWSMYADLSALGHIDDVKAAAFSPDNAYLVTTGRDNQMILWSVAAKSKLNAITLPDTPWTLSVSPLATSGSLPVAVTLLNGNALLIDMLAAAPLPPIQTMAISGTTGYFAEGVTFSPDGHSLAIGAEDNSFYLWTSGTGTSGFSKALPAFTMTDTIDYQSYNQVAFSPSGRYLATAQGDDGQGGYLRVWEVATRRITGMQGPSWYPVSVAFSPDGTGVVAGEIICGKLTFCHD